MFGRKRTRSPRFETGEVESGSGCDEVVAHLAGKFQKVIVQTQHTV